MIQNIRISILAFNITLVKFLENLQRGDDHFTDMTAAVHTIAVLRTTSQPCTA